MPQRRYRRRKGSSDEDEEGAGERQEEQSEEDVRYILRNTASINCVSVVRCESGGCLSHMVCLCSKKLEETRELQRFRKRPVGVRYDKHTLLINCVHLGFLATQCCWTGIWEEVH